ncbi:MAG: DUF4139 domain-containing protein [Methanotrichaceae archaeon]
MKTILAFLVLLLALSQVVASEDDGPDQIEATTIISLPVDSVTIYPDGLATVKRTGSMEVTEGMHKFVLDLPRSVSRDTIRFAVTNATVEKIIYDDNLEYNLNVSSTGVQDFELSYLMRNAGYWMPSYSLYLDEDSILVSAYAIVENNFDEDLQNVRLKLVAGPPQVKAVIAPRASSYLAECAEEAPAPKKIGAGSSTGNLEMLYIYELECRKDLEMDKEVGLPLFEEASPIKRVYTWDAYTRNEGPVMEMVRANNTMKDPWPAGSALLYRNGEYVSRIDVPYTPTGTEASIAVGSSADMTVSKKLANYTIDEDIKEITGAGNTTHMVRVTTETWTYQLSLESNLDKNASLEVTDRKSLKADIVSVDPVPSETTATSLKWELELEPREKTVINYTYKIATTESLDGSS